MESKHHLIDEKNTAHAAANTRLNKPAVFKLCIPPVAAEMLPCLADSLCAGALGARIDLHNVRLFDAALHHFANFVGGWHRFVAQQVHGDGRRSYRFA